MRKWTVCALAVVASITVSAGRAEGLISEIRFGALAHDPGIFSNAVEEGVDINGELLFEDLHWFDGGWEARPSLGVSVNTEGDTSQLYGGLTIGGPIAGPMFVEFGAGAAVHDGDIDPPKPGSKDLGCRVLFHLSGSLGVMVSDNVSLSAYLDHVSNADLCDHNPGMESVGARVGFRF